MNRQLLLDAASRYERVAAERAFRAEQPAIEAYSSLLEAVSSMLARVKGVPYVSPDNSGCLRDAQTPLAVVLQGLPLMDHALFYGYYAQLSVMQKQMLDALTISKDRELGKVRFGKAPNASNTLGQKVGVIKKLLDGVSHLTEGDVPAALAMDAKGLSIASRPRFIQGSFREMIDIQIFLLGILFVRCDEVWAQCYGLEQDAEEVDALKASFEFLRNSSKRFR